MTPILLAVNGTLMRGLELNPNMTNVGGIFVREDNTDAHYRLWSINDRHPGIALEIWQLPPASFAQLLSSEPAGLSIGKIKLQDGSEVLGVLAEPWLVEGQKDITETGSWRRYTGHHHTV